MLSNYKIAQRLEDDDGITVLVNIFEGDMQDVKESDPTNPRKTITVNRFVRSGKVEQRKYRFDAKTTDEEMENFLNKELADATANDPVPAQQEKPDADLPDVPPEKINA